MNYNEVLIAGAASIGPMEFWCIVHPEGPLIETASKDLTMPVRIFCDAVELDWDEAVDQGFTLGVVTLTPDQAAALPKQNLLGDLHWVMNTQ